MWLTHAATVVVGTDWTLHPWRHNIVGGVTAGQARHNSSNVGGVTAGQVGHNSSLHNYHVLLMCGIFTKRISVSASAIFV